jgi:hypothetical protein
MPPEQSGVHPTTYGLYGSSNPYQPFLPAGFWKSGRTLRISGCLLLNGISPNNYADINMKVGLNYPNSVGQVETATTMPVQMNAPDYYLPYYFEYYMICIGTTDPNQQYATFDTYGNARYNFKFKDEIFNGFGVGSANYWPNIEPIKSIPGSPNFDYFPGDIQTPEVETQDTQPYIQLQSTNLEVKLRHIIVEQLI